MVRDDPSALRNSATAAGRLRLMIAVLSVTAGSLDVITFLGMGGLFSAQITGNLVVLAAHMSIGVPVRTAVLLAVPVFMAILALTKVLAVRLSATGRDPLRPLLF